MKFLYGRKRIKYYIECPDDEIKLVDFEFSQIAYESNMMYVANSFRNIKVDCEKKLLRIELDSIPSFSQKKAGKWIKSGDFTE